MRVTSALVSTLILVSSGLSAQTLNYVSEGTANYFEAGWSMSRTGDLNADNVPDLLVGCTESVLGNGTVLAISLADGSIIHTWTGEAITNKFGSAMDGGLDVDGDNVPDVVIGAPGWDLTHQFDNRGRAYVYSGATYSLLFQVTGANALEGLGSAVALIPDMNADGKAEVAVGAPGVAANTGQVVVYSGATGLPLHTYSGVSIGEWFGTAISEIGDLDGDSVPDMLIGAPYNAIGGTAGRVYVLSGATGNVIRLVDGQQSGEHMGQSIADLQDIDGDSVPDFVVGAPDYDAGLVGVTVDAGRARAVSGATGTFLWSIEGPQVYMKAGLCVDSVQDLSGDGVNDALIGMPYIPT